jgi:hypothetical protein
VVGLVTSVHDPKPVTLRVTQGADRARIVSATVHTVDMHADNEIPYDVELSCPRAAAKTYAIGLQSSTPDRMLAGGGIELSCGGLAGVVAPAALEPPLPPRAAAANAVPDVKVNVNSNTQTNPNPNPNPHAQPVANAQTGFAYEQQQGFQLALAEDQGARAQLGEEYAMSGRPLDPGPGLGLGAAAMLAGATGVALRRRRQVQPAAARARR